MMQLHQIKKLLTFRSEKFFQKYFKKQLTRKLYYDIVITTKKRGDTPKKTIQKTKQK